MARKASLQNIMMPRWMPSLHNFYSGWHLWEISVILAHEFLRFGQKMRSRWPLTTKLWSVRPWVWVDVCWTDWRMSVTLTRPRLSQVWRQGNVFLCDFRLLSVHRLWSVLLMRCLPESTWSGSLNLFQHLNLYFDRCVLTVQTQVFSHMIRQDRCQWRTCLNSNFTCLDLLVSVTCLRLIKSRRVDAGKENLSLPVCPTCLLVLFLSCNLWSL